MQRNSGLDGLRGIAALSVFWFHLEVLDGGMFGVDMFFVLSGFLITSLLAREFERTAHIDFARFYAARALRLVPALLLFVTAYFFLAGAMFPGSPIGLNASLILLYLTDYSIPYWRLSQDASSLTWSLSVEGKFYLIWPVLMGAFLLRQSWQKRALMLLALYVVATAWRMYRADTAPWAEVYHPFDSRVSGLILGALLATVIGKFSLNRVTALAAGMPSALILGALLVLTNRHSNAALGLSTTLIELATVGLIVALQYPGPISRVLSIAPLVFTGRISYAFYLWHLLVGRMLGTYAGQDSYLATWPVLLALTYTCAIVSWYAVERRFAQVRKRIAASATMPTTAKTAT